MKTNKQTFRQVVNNWKYTREEIIYHQTVHLEDYIYGRILEFKDNPEMMIEMYASLLSSISDTMKTLVAANHKRASYGG